MGKKTLRAGIAGSGFAARFHYEALKRVFGVEVKVAGAFSKDPAQLELFAKERSIKIVKDYHELLDACDLVHLCTPPATHEQLTIEALACDKHVIVEKPFTGYFGDDSESFSGDTFPREEGMRKATESITRMLDAERKSKGKIMYAENWIYAPSIQKEKELIQKTGSRILWIQAQQSHSGSHSPDYGKWRLSGGGSLMGKGVHPLAAAIYFKHTEGLSRNGTPIHPRYISARVHAITRMPNFKNTGKQLKDSYTDIEDYAFAHVVFEDGTIADIVAGEIMHGGVKNYVEVHADNHRTICNIAPNNAMQTYNPSEENFRDIYVVEKTGTKQGWSNMSPDESWFGGYQHEMEAFYNSAAYGIPLESNSRLAADVITTVYAGYLSAERRGAEVPVILTE